MWHFLLTASIGDKFESCVLELLSLKRVQQFQFVREEEAAVLVDRIRKACLIKSKDCFVNLSEMLTATSNNIVCRSVLGQSFEEKDGQIFGGLTRTVMDMFVGGTDTTLTALEWTMAELLRNPRVMEKAQEEVRAVVGKKAKEMKDAGDEGRQRETSSEIPSLGGYHQSSDAATVTTPTHPSSLDQPEDFIPERFQNSTLDFKGLDFEFIPFGFGRRGCPGLTFGITSTEYLIANLLYWFEWKLSTEDGGILPEELDMSEVYGLTVYKKVHLRLVPIPYFP
ncbi:Cytochrome P450 71A1 [Morus notabilis]|uniref:Cytochrome P450 71A1 n=1 Tax=Morus notabilis TaxID=981085 RepID=W9RSP3_9ROSA|nr:Cytochrome P450 71A1 [Morus notabilis]